jgi:hypothetical protein
MADSYRGFQKNVTVRLYPEEIQALEVIAKLAGWDGKSTALREFMKIWVECAVVAIEQQSTAKGSLQMLKSMIRINKQIDTIQKKAKESKESNMLHEHDLEILKGCLAR